MNVVLKISAGKGDIDEQGIVRTRQSFYPYFGEGMKQMSNKLFRCIFFSAILFLVPIRSSAGALYKWVDEEGTVHMTDSLGNVPPQYRDQIETKKFQTTTDRDLQPDTQGTAARDDAEPSMPNLNWFEVPYKAFEGNARRIIIPVTFNNSVKADLLLDTGSPNLMISPKLADRLGLIKEDDGNLMVMAGGIGGMHPAMLAIVDTVSVGDARSEFLPAIITEISSLEYEGLVGMDFLANYEISIDSEDKVVVFSELPSRSDKPGGYDESWWRSNFQSFSKLKTEWGNMLDYVKNASLTSSESDRLLKIVQKQYDEADNVCRKLERYARENAVPSNWRR